MKRCFSMTFIAVWAALVAALSSEAQGSTAQLFGRADGVGDPQLSPTGSKLAIECAPEGVPSLCVFDLSGQSQPALLPLDTTYRLKWFRWADDTRLVFAFGTFETFQAVGGLMEFEVWRAVSYDTETGKSTMLMSDNRGLIDTSNVISFLPQDDKHVLIESIFYEGSSSIGSIIPESDDAGFSLQTYKTNLRTGKTRRAKKFTPSTDHVVYGRNGDAVARVIRNERANSFAIYRGNTVIYSDDNAARVTVWPIALEETRGELVVWVDEGTDRGLNYMSLENGQMTPVTIEGKPVGIADHIIDERSRTLVGVEYGGDFVNQVFIQPDLARAHKTLKASFPDKHITFTSWTDDRSKIAVRAESHGRPADFYVFDAASNSMSGIGSVASHMVERQMGSVIPVSYSARDGLQIPGYVTLPPGKTTEDGPFPLVVLPHGGPMHVWDDAQFDWWAQAYAAEGFAVLKPNYRGSGGYSARLADAGYGEYGNGMVTDVIDGAAWAKAQGIANDDGYCIVGASYGGYSALMVAARDPQNVKCAVSVNGVTDPIAISSRHPPRSDAFNAYRRLVGLDRFSSEEALKQIQPTAYASSSRVPTLVIHGREDVRVPFEQFTGLKAAAHRNPYLQFVELDGEDHFLQSTFVRSEVLERSISFLHAHMSMTADP